MKLRRILSLLAFVAANAANASVTLPYVFSAGQTITASQTNANLSALMNEINAHEALHNGHNTALSDVLASNNSCGTYSINFNLNPALNFRAENVSSDPLDCGASTQGRLIWNSALSLFKICNGSSYVSIAGTGVNTLSSVLTAGNSAGASNINVNGNQLLDARVENVASDPSAGQIGRLFYNTTSAALKLDNGSSLVAIGGSQGLSSVLGVSNSAGTSDINFNGHQALNVQLESLATDPATTNAGRVYFNSASSVPKFYNGTSWLSVGNTNTLSQTLALGNSVGSSDINFNGHQAIAMRVFNNAGSPGTANPGELYYDTVAGNLNYETATINHTLVDIDQSQTLTNKTISGASNTITNVQDSSLSANVALLNNSQTISGTKTFSTAPVISNIKTPAGTTNGHVIPNGLADDTFVLANAVQTLAGKTLTAPTLTGSTDFSEGQGVNLRLENLSVQPAAGNAGRVFYDTATGEIRYDTGTSWLALTTNAGQNLASTLLNGNSAGTSNINMNDNQILNMEFEKVGALPAAGNQGRVLFDTANNTIYADSGASFFAVASPATPTWATVLSNGNSAGATNPDFNENQALHMRAENNVSDPTAGNAGRLYYNTSTKQLKIDNGTSFDVVGPQSPQTLTATVSATATVNQSYIIANCAANCTITLPAISSLISTYDFKVKNIATTNVTVVGSGADQIDGAANAVMNFQWQSITLTPTSSGWLIQ